VDAQRPARGDRHERCGGSNSANQRKRLRLSLWFRLCVGFGVRIDVRFFKRLQQRLGKQVQRIVVLHILRQRLGQRKRVEFQRVGWDGDVLDLMGGKRVLRSCDRMAPSFAGGRGTSRIPPIVAAVSASNANGYHASWKLAIDSILTSRSGSYDWLELL